MSSATSTSATDSHARTRSDEGFRVPHFFVFLSLIAATGAVVMVRPAPPENLVLISLTIGAAGLAAIAFYWTIAPLVSAASDEDREPLSARLRADLEREKALTLRSIKELEFDRAMGKVSEEDFAQMAARLRARAMGIMKQLDAGASVYRQEIEKELASRIGARRGATPDPKVRTPHRADLTVRPAADADADLQVRQRGSTCACGTSNDADARFCKSCGAKLTGDVR